MAYYGGAWLGVHQTVTPEGIAVLWPANAVVLAALLILPWRYWPGVALAVMAAEIVADLPAFPLWAAVAFGLINLFEVSLGALLIRRVAVGPFDFSSLRNAAAFLFFGPFLAASLAGLMGAAVYVALARSDTPFAALWQLWWFGDALGLLLLTPLMVVVWRWQESGLPRIRPAVLVEAVALGAIVVTVGLIAFKAAEPGRLAFFVEPVWLAVLAVVAGLRLGVIGATATVTLIAAVTVANLTYGLHPFGQVAPQYAVWLTQEYLAILAVVSLGLAVLMGEINEQRKALNRAKLTLQQTNAELENRVHERTLELQQANEALEALNKKLAVVAATDDLTGMSNRRSTYDKAERILQRLRQENGTASVIMIDLDRFKEINDGYSHDAGDLVLKSLREPIERSLKPSDLVGRIGGEEFLILLPGVARDTAIKIAERVRAAINATELDYKGFSIRLSASLGVAQWDGRSTLDELVHNADKALYLAKQNGRNRVECHGTEPPGDVALWPPRET